MKDKRTISFITFFLIAILANAYTLSGKVKTDSQEALPFVSVYLKDVHLGATTDLDGEYTIKDIPAGQHTLVVSYVGYETQTFELNTEKDDARDFTLHEQAITLDDVFITPTGESIERFILSQVVKNSQKLSKRVSSFCCTQNSRIEQRNNNMKVIVEPYLKILNLALSIMGYRDIVNIIMNHPNLRIETQKEFVLQKGNMTVADAHITYCNPQLDDKESKAWIKFYSKNRGNEYDKYYDEIANIHQELAKLDKKTPGESAKHLTYGGAYDENENTIHIIKYDKSQYHIVDGCWQIRRIVKEKGEKDHSLSVEFHELAKKVYMPVSKYAEIDFTFEKMLKEELDELKKENKSNISSKQLTKNNDRIKTIEEVLQSGASVGKTTTTFIYKNFNTK